MSSLIIHSSKRGIHNSTRFGAVPTLSNNEVLESVLADIPFFSVGLLGFAVATFLFVLRKSTKPALYVILSTLAAFLGAIFDLSVTLARGNGSNSLAHHESIVPLTVSREVAFGLSVAMRFFYFWAFCALPPRGETSLTPVAGTNRASLSDGNGNSASWARWGIVGNTINLLLLLGVVAVAALQITWRIGAAFAPKVWGLSHPVYQADSFLQIALSTAFALKLCANVWLTPLFPRWRTVADYAPILVAILVGKSVAIADVLTFQISDSALGRFLQAIQLYIMILYVMITRFYKPPAHRSMMVEIAPRTSVSPFRGLSTRSAGSTFQVSPPTVSTPEPAEVQPQPNSTAPSRPPPPARLSTAERLASWLTSRLSARQDADQTRLWNKNVEKDLEGNMLQAEEKTGRSEGSFVVLTPTEPPEVGTWKDPVFTTVIRTPTTKTVKTPKTASSTAGLSSEGLFRVTMDYSSSSRPGSDLLAPPPQTSRAGSESPVYGLDGIMPASKRSDSPQPSPGMQDLLRRQAELDRSVAGLQLFSPHASVNSRSNTTRSDLTRLQMPHSALESASNRSDFSLSNFPSPPFAFESFRGKRRSSDSKGVSTGTAYKLPTPVSGSRTSESIGVPDVLSMIGPPRMPILANEGGRQQSFPLTERGSVPLETQARMDSYGTQYDVTSFIGDLTTPNVVTTPHAPRYPSNLRDGGIRDSVDSEQMAVDSSDQRGSTTTPSADTPLDATIVDIRSEPPSITRARFIPSVAGEIGQFPAPALPVSPPASEAPSPTPAVRRLNINTSLPYTPRPVQLVSRDGAPSTSRRPNPSLPRPRLLPISGPISPSPIDQPQSFERPRPAPLVLKKPSEDGNSAAPAPKYF